jgi:hypothetical protein
MGGEGRVNMEGWREKGGEGRREGKKVKERRT